MPKVQYSYWIILRNRQTQIIEKQKTDGSLRFVKVLFNHKITCIYKKVLDCTYIHIEKMT